MYVSNLGGDLLRLQSTEQLAEQSLLRLFGGLYPSSLRKDKTTTTSKQRIVGVDTENKWERCTAVKLADCHLPHL